jgi:outer membrane protein OmpA-like peptidoglycan-associated protein
MAFRIPVILFVSAVVISVAHAVASDRADVKGGKDHPVVSRYQDSWQVAFGEQPFEGAALPLAVEFRTGKYVKAQQVEGRITRSVYVAPAGRGPFEVHRNYEDALAKAGFQKGFGCSKNDCFKGTRVQQPLLDNIARMTQVRDAQYSGGVGFLAVNSFSEPYYSWMKLARPGGEVYVILYTTRIENVSRKSGLFERTATYVEVIEPKAMETGKVVVDAAALAKALQAEGKVAVYGIYFDTDKAEVKPESKAALDELAKLLQGSPALKVYIVGHTDNQGALDYNLALSQKRAEAVAHALARTYNIESGRMAAKGVASLAPTASNDAETGRAKNRRVELVKQ